MGLLNQRVMSTELSPSLMHTVLLLTLLLSAPFVIESGVTTGTPVQSFC